LGSTGDLVQVKVSKLKTGGSASEPGDRIVRHTQYRYDSPGLLKAVFEPDAVERLVEDRSDISGAADILAKADDDDNSGTAAHKIKDYASRRFSYYTCQLCENDCLFSS
jgi:hypothetical protein